MTTRDNNRGALFNERFYTSDDGLALYFADFPGPPDPTLAPIVCLPGLTRNSRDFEHLAAQLCTSHRVICPDFRGRGRSEYDPVWHNYRPAQYAADVLTLLQHIDVHRVSLIGTSLGGLVSMLLASDRPELLAAVVLNDIGPDIDPRGLLRITATAGKLARADTFDAAMANTRANYEIAFPDWSEAEWQWYAGITYRQTKSGDFDLNYDRGIGEAVRSGAAGVAREPWSVFDGLENIPTLLVRGELSDIMTAAIAAKMQSRKPDLQVVAVRNRGHAPVLTEPEALNAITQLLADV